MIVDKLSNLLMQAPLETRTRARIIQFISDFGESNPDSNEDLLKVATWLMLCAPDYQRN